MAGHRCVLLFKSGKRDNYKAEHLPAVLKNLHEAEAL
jgi:hypothetical protein